MTEDGYCMIIFLIINDNTTVMVMLILMITQFIFLKLKSFLYHVTLISGR